MEKQAAPVFVKIHNYKEVLDILDVLKHKIAESKEVLARLQELKEEEDATLQETARDMEDVERKLAYMDKTLFEPEV